MYLTVANNPRSKRYLREETILACVIPGPTEPSLKQLNPILDPIVDELHELYGGEFSHHHRNLVLMAI